MDASASHRADAEINDLYAFFLNIGDTEFPTPFKQRNTVIKYTKLPEFDFESKGSCRQKCYSEPRFRRIITLEEPAIKSSRSFKLAEPICYSKVMATSLNKRKIVTISEDDEYDLHPKFSKDTRKPCTTSNRSTGTEQKNEGKPLSQRTTSRLMKPTKYLKETKSSAKKTNAYDRKDVSKSSNSKTKLLNNDHGSLESIRSRNPRDKDTARRTKSVALSKTSVSRNYAPPKENERDSIFTKAKLYDNSKCNTSAKKCIEKSQSRTHNMIKGKRKESYLVETPGHKVVPVIHVPLDEKYRKDTEVPSNPVKSPIMSFAEPNRTVDTEIIVRKNVSTGTDTPLVKTVDQMTDMEGIQAEIIYKCADVQTDLIHETFDKLDIPNVSLKKDKSVHHLSDLHAKSLPNLQLPRVKFSDNRHNEESALDTKNCNSTSYIISRATLTYTSKQKINFQVVGSNDNQYSNQSPSPLKYPFNVVSVFKKEMSSKDARNNDSTLQECTNKSDSSKEFKNCINEIKSLNCSYGSNSNKLMKPSDIISTIRVDNSLLKNVYLCEQFQRELNFIDSFFESLQYLESCANSERCAKNDKIQRLVNNPELLEPEIVKNSEYDNFLSTLDNGTNSEDSETMASKNLFLLNILIRDEQRRAKNLLSVLKRREDALKDFTKSQILYLENKKKQENTDITVLKKKQRGALLKLQHECGEMQRMRKALLALSEKRKLALMKTKKDLELKLNNNVDVEQIILGKKKLKRNISLDRTSVPLKCFDLSSSGCEDSTSSRSTSEDAVPAAVVPIVVESVTSAEKSIQTCDILEPTSKDQSNDAAAENFVVVDGGYLNILFHNLSLPQIFSGGKHYEVNEVALKNIVDSTNTVYSDNWDEFMEKLMEQSKNDEDKSSTPSTARSLVEEFEQYYRTFAEEDKVQQVDEYEVASKEHVPPSVGSETDETTTQDAYSKIESCETHDLRCADAIAESVAENEASLSISTVDETCECVLLLPDIDTEPVTTVTGPLPVPPGASDVSSTTTFSEGSASSEPPACVLAQSASSLAEPAHEEAEELRRQQLAIEREIKELEQQQCRLLVVREIPDKPPPPYTPPAEVRSPKQLTRFRPDGVDHDKIRKYIIEDELPSYDHTDAFEVLVQDFCQDTRDRLKSECNDKPWEPCNLLPEKTPLDPEEVVKAASTELLEVLTAVTPSIMSNVSSRRSDHIDDILFAEWRRVEPEWTSLQSDEVQVKNQVFETIFQRILTETVDEYKRTVLSPVPG